MAIDNRTIGKFRSRHSAGAAGMPQVEVTSKSTPTGSARFVQGQDHRKEQKIRIESSSGLSYTEIDRWEALELHANEDAERREAIESATSSTAWCTRSRMTE